MLAVTDGPRYTDLRRLLLQAFAPRALAGVVDRVRELIGRLLDEGDLVTPWFSSPNFDETVFAEPDRFDLARTPNKHLPLGYGRHFCLGASLGRVEINSMLEGLRDRVRGINLTAAGKPIYSNFLSGMSSLPVALKR
ncbi:hypothetical protein GCM10010172_04040 [Paractinoplanes ferrugineus]|uniref:Cytochrome P450 n=2 Tax=Paractinoplanes ferrugineus TaxID=113564 RepID=A0A919J722_9ACTN|nr:hypothetical protein Afe05nite_56490 [Actinoplanes ferrugineus]